MGAGRKTQTVDVDSKAYGQLSFEQRQRNLGPAQLKGCIFGQHSPPMLCLQPQIPTD